MLVDKFTKTKDISLFNYRGDIPVILLYQFVTKSILLFTLRFFRELDGIILWNDDKPALSTGKIPELMSSWQGRVLFVLGILSLVVYTMFDVNTTIIMSDKILHQKRISIPKLLKETISSLKYFMSPLGLLVIIYTAVVGPLFGAPLGIALTTNFSVPEKIISLIFDDPLNRILYSLLLAILLVIGLYFIFVYQYAILGKMKTFRAMKNSRKVVIENWRDFFARMITFIIRSAVLFVGVELIAFVIPTHVLELFLERTYLYKVGIVFFTTLAITFAILFFLIFSYFFTMKLTMIYESYTAEDEGDYVFPERGKRTFTVTAGSIVFAMICAFSIVTAGKFDDFFPSVYATNIIAHRAGGYLGNENTIVALDRAAKEGMTSAEIDVQRTSDGWYVINHDATFYRCCGVREKVEDMTLDDVMQLRVKNNFSPEDSDTDVATIDEMVKEAKKLNIHLFVELKGDTADRQMADEVYDIVDKLDYLEGCTFIGMNFDTIYYLESMHPDAETGYLCFYSYGNIRNMKCDALLLRTDAASQTNVDVAHQNGKKVYVWTVNTVNGLSNFLTSDVDGIITDEVTLAKSTIDTLNERDDEARVLQWFINLWKKSNTNR